ncbi:MAG: MCE family protein [Elusimicrobia bacterium]|nr:MCE family protein [Elusimicrobiota bacterium]
MSTEAKVGAFIIAGLVFMGVAIFLLGDFTFERRYQVYVLFSDVAGLSEKAPVKLSGVEVGKVRRIELAGDKAKVVAALSREVTVYKDAVFSIGSTGIIGSKFLQIEQGSPAAGPLPPESQVIGEDPVSIEKALTKALASLQGLLGDLSGPPGQQGLLAKNVNATVSNVRSLTATLDEMLADAKPAVTRSLKRMDEITAKLDAVLAKTDQMMAAINQSKGPVGALLHDEAMKKDIQQTVANVREAAGTAKDVLGRMTQFRVWWNYDWRYEHALKGGRTDIGLKISPREGRYYYLGGNNFSSPSDETRGIDYQRKNTVDALLGWEGRRWDVGVGVLRSAGGARVTVRPGAPDPFWGRFSAFAEAYDFGRNRVVEGRRLDHPVVGLGGKVQLHRVVGIGARVEDLQEVTRVQSWLNVMFEDKDVAYLLGMVSFGAAGTKGRSKKD